MQSSLATTSMFTRLFVVYETHLVHAMHLQMNLEWFCIWTFFLDVHDDVFGNNRLPFFNNKPMFWNWTAFCIISGSCMFSSTSLWTR